MSVPPVRASHQCPRCGSYDTRRSIQSGFVDSFVQMFDLLPYRCRGCRKRFMRKSPKVETAAQQTPEAKTEETPTAEQ